MLFKKFILAAAVLTFLITGCAKPPVIMVKAGSGDQTVTAKAGKTFSIQLEAQLSTGYSWKLIDAPSSLITEKEDILRDSKNIDIAGGFEIQEFILKSMTKGEFTLTFKYGQHWKKNPDYAKTSAVKVRIE